MIQIDKEDADRVGCAIGAVSCGLSKLMATPVVVGNLADQDADAFAADPDVKELRPGNGSALIGVSELWRYRELLWFLALRDVQVRYKQTALGALWAVIQPFVMMVVLSYVLRTLGQKNMSDPVFLYAGLLPWTLFAASVTAATNSLVSNADMLRKIYFPRLMVPLASIGAPLVDFAVAFVILFAMMAWYGVTASSQLLLIPLLLMSTVVASLGVGILLAALSVTYRDFRYVVPFLISIGFFVSGIIYDVDQAHWLMHLNPMSGIIAGFRSAILGTEINWLAWRISFASACVCMAIGLVYFSRTQRRFADVV